MPFDHQIATACQFYNPFKAGRVPNPDNGSRENFYAVYVAARVELIYLVHTESLGEREGVVPCILEAAASRRANIPVAAQRCFSPLLCLSDAFCPRKLNLSARSKNFTTDITPYSPPQPRFLQPAPFWSVSSGNGVRRGKFHGVWGSCTLPWRRIGFF